MWKYDTLEEENGILAFVQKIANNCGKRGYVRNQETVNVIIGKRNQWKIILMEIPYFQFFVILMETVINNKLGSNHPAKNQKQ